MPKIRRVVLAGTGFLIVVIGLVVASIAIRSSHVIAIPTRMLLPTAEVASNQLAASGVTATSGQAIQGESLATSLPLPTTTPPLLIPTTVPPSLTEPPAMSMPQQPVANQVVIRFAPDTSPHQRATYIRSFGGTIQQEIDELQTVVVYIPAGANILTSPLVVDFERDYYLSALNDVSTSDVYYPAQWALPVIGAPEAWTKLPDDAPDVIVAVVDSGVCLDHPDLLGKFLPGYDFVQDDNIPQDDFGHGCGVAGIIAANIDNGTGIAGVAPNARIMPLRVLDGNGIGTYSDVAAAIVRAVDDGARIINLSLGGANTTTTLQNAIDYAIAHDVLVIAAAGNTGGSVLYPAAYDPVVAVASVDSDLQMSSFSSRGAEIDLLAPGRDILTTTRGNSYTPASGTSFSAPHVTGVAALEMALGNTLTINGGIVSVNGSSIRQPTPVWLQLPPLPTQSTPDDVVQPKNPLPKVSHDLAALLTEYQAFQAQGADASFVTANVFMPLQNGLVVIDASSSGDPYNLLADLQALGLQKGAVAGYLVSGVLPINSISSLPTLDNLQFVNPAYSITRSGTVNSQGDLAMQADIARATYGVDGSGIRIGVLSNSFDCEGLSAATDIANGELPSDIIVLEDAPCLNAGLGVTQLVPDGARGTSQTFHAGGGIPSSISPGDDEGRGIMQQIYDVAPNISMSFSSTSGQAHMAQAIIDLTNNGGAASTTAGITDLSTAGADVIVDDILYLDEPMFQDGVIAQAVNQVVAMGIPYFSSAGNDARQSYESLYRSSGIAGVLGIRHDFNSGAGVDSLQSVTIPAGQSVQIVLQWDQPFYSVSGSPGSASDVDIYLYTSGGVLLTGAADDNLGNDPVEILTYSNPSNSSEVNFQLAIELYAGPNPTRMKYVYFNAEMTVNEFATNSSTLYGHPNAVGAETVGAAAFYDTPRYGTNPPVLEEFSSWGGTPILFDTSGSPTFDLRQKPEIVAPDGGNTTFFGSPDIPEDPDTYPNFFGTSASAPHAAAVAALMLEYDRFLTPADVYSYMETTALNLGTLGFDYASGYGLINANAILAALPLTPKNLSATAVSPSQINLNWTDMFSNETAFLAERSLNAVTWAQVAIVPANTTHYEDKNLICGTIYHYRVRAFRSSDNAVSSYSNAASTATLPCPPLNAPSGLAANTVSMVVIQLTWVDGSPGETTRFYIERTLSGTGGWQEAGINLTAVTSFTDDDLSCGHTYDYRVRAYRGADQAYSPFSAPVTKSTDPCPVAVTTTTGLYQKGIWLFRDANNAGLPAIRFAFGPQEAGWKAMTGDWDGDGEDGIGLYKDGIFALRNVTGGGLRDVIFEFGPKEAGWLPIVGDWNGDDVVSVGLYKQGVFLLRDSNTTGAAEYRVLFGDATPGWQPIAGDWDGSGADTIGLYRQGNFYLTNTLVNSVMSRPFVFGPSQTGWSPVSGDWNADGMTTVGVYSEGIWRLRNHNDAGTPDLGFTFGERVVGWQPLASYRGTAATLTLMSQSESFVTEPLPGEVPTTTTLPETALPTEEATVTETPVPTEEATVAETPVESSPEATLPPEIPVITPEATAVPTITPVEATPVPTVEVETTTTPDSGA